ncbi:hypothetical protein DRQ09_03030 [candidate division KSB1 bacterium]|mgnify:CR=1 FL=1|nr:MAG: hypothetical protein DRQ09_03030 [candidate division KSB1 bacterium]
MKNYINIVKEKILKIDYKGKKFLISFSGIIVIIIGIILINVKSSTPDIATYTVVKGPFIISISEHGELMAKESTTIYVPSDVRGNLQIIYLAEEGKPVKKGDVLIQFDTSELDTRIETLESTLQQAQEDYEKLKANQESQMATLLSNLETTKNNYELSKLRLEQMKFEADTKKQMEELNFKNAQISLKKQENNIKNQRIVNKVNLNAALLKIENAKKDLEKAKAEKERLTVRAPNDGLVVYRENYRSGTRAKIQVGDTPHRRQPLIDLPNLEIMQVKTQVNEIDIRRVKKGQKAIIRLDAFQNVEFTGTVTDIAYLARREYGSNVKVFDVIITIDEKNHPLLKPGMSATVDIILDKIDTALYVPLESVFEEEGKTVMYLVEDSYKKVEVKTGKSNDDYVIISEGLKEGDKVALRNPTIKLEEFGAEIKEKKQKPTSPSSKQGTDIRAIRKFLRR